MPTSLKLKMMAKIRFISNSAFTISRYFMSDEMFTQHSRSSLDFNSQTFEEIRMKLNSVFILLIVKLRIAVYPLCGHLCVRPINLAVIISTDFGKYSF